MLQGRCTTLSENQRRRLDIEKLKRPRFRLESPPTFPPFQGCAVSIVPVPIDGVSASSGNGLMNSRVCQVLSSRRNVIVRCADGAEEEVAWEIEEERMASSATDKNQGNGRATSVATAATENDISRMLFSDSEDNEDEADVETGETSAAMGEIWKYLHNLGIGANDLIEIEGKFSGGDSAAHNGTHRSAYNTQAEQDAMLEAEQYFQRFHESNRVNIRLVRDAPTFTADSLGTVFGCLDVLSYILL